MPVPPSEGASDLNPYADFMMQIDHHMGEPLDAVEQAGLEDDTLIVFTSDNGCSPEANFPLLREHGHDPSGSYRGHKADIYEGGHRVPLIVRWPGHIEPGRKTDAMTCLTDLYPTFEQITEQDRQATGGEDGYSLLPVFNAATTSERETLVSHSISGSFAIHKGNWKLCLSAGSGGWSDPREDVARKQDLPAMQLYDLAEDPAETNNLVNEKPEKVRDLLPLLDQQDRDGRSTPGDKLSNDRNVSFLPAGVTLPQRRQ